MDELQGDEFTQDYQSIQNSQYSHFTFVPENIMMNEEGNNENKEMKMLENEMKMKTLKKEERKSFLEEKKKSYFQEPFRVIFDMFLVDSFKYRTKNHEYYLLSHFHSDHYEGITKKWSHGRIIGTEITLKCLQKDFQIPNQYLITIEYNTPMIILGKYDEEYSITALNAGHAPGSCCFLIENLKEKKKILHVGDFRFDKKLMKDEGWNKYVKNQNIDILYLDTTYADKQYQFDSREIVCQQIANKAWEEMGNTLIVVGSYKIGKEMVAEEIAKKCNLKIQVTEEKYEYIKICERDLSLYTTQKSSLQLRNKNNGLTQLQMELKENGGEYNKVIKIEATGWSKKMKCKGVYNLKEYSFPYSEHSSFKELIDCYKFVQPKEIIPTVPVRNCTSKEVAQLIIKESKPKKNTLDLFLKLGGL